MKNKNYRFILIKILFMKLDILIMLIIIIICVFALFISFFKIYKTHKNKILIDTFTSQIRKTPKIDFDLINIEN